MSSPAWCLSNGCKAPCPSRGIWLEDVSYSFYLIHLPVLMALIYVLYPIAPLWLIVSVALPLMLLAGHLMHRAVERPSLRFGRSLSQRL